RHARIADQLALANALPRLHHHTGQVSVPEGVVRGVDLDAGAVTRPGRLHAHVAADHAIRRGVHGSTGGDADVDGVVRLPVHPGDVRARSMSARVRGADQGPAPPQRIRVNV